MDCSGAQIAGPYTYTISNPATVGNTMSVDCNGGLVWTSAPYNSPHNATCTNVNNNSTWVINPSGNCVGNLCNLDFALSRNLLNTYANSYTIIFDCYILVDCSGTLLAGAGFVTYTIPSPALQGTTMQVTCQSGYNWNMAPYSGSQNATCVNASNTAQWSISWGSFCVGNIILYSYIH